MRGPGPQGAITGAVTAASFTSGAKRGVCIGRGLFLGSECSTRSCPLVPVFARLGYSKVAVKIGERVACVFADLVDTHRVANMGVLERSEFIFLAGRGDGEKAPVAD